MYSGIEHTDARTILGSGPDDVKTRVLETAAALIAGLCKITLT